MGCDMVADASDIRKPVQYYSHAANQQMLLMGFALAGISAGALFVVDQYVRQIMAGCGIALGLGCIGYAIMRMQAPPMLVLSDLGVDYRILGAGAVFIPWSVVNHIGRMDFRRSRAVFRDVTTLEVSRDFYEREIVPQLSRIFANTGVNFAKGEHRVQVALHHEAIGVSGEALRREALARWEAFRRRSEEPEPSAQTP